MAKKRTTAQRRAAAKASWAARRAAENAPKAVAGALTNGAVRSKTPYKLAVLNTREPTHGDYNVNAAVSQALKKALATFVVPGKLTAIQQEALDLMFTKIGRIVAGDASFVGHWQDLAGYPTLVAENQQKAADAGI